MVGHEWEEAELVATAPYASRHWEYRSVASRQSLHICVRTPFDAAATANRSKRPGMRWVTPTMLSSVSR